MRHQLDPKSTDSSHSKYHLPQQVESLFKQRRCRRSKPKILYQLEAKSFPIGNISWLSPNITQIIWVRCKKFKRILKLFNTLGTEVINCMWIACKRNDKSWNQFSDSIASFYSYHVLQIAHSLVWTDHEFISFRFQLFRELAFNEWFVS